jgi:hypothetical protein
LHDGRAKTLVQAVALHGGQGAESAHRFRSLSPTDRSLVQAFLKLLAAPGSARSPEVLRAVETELTALQQINNAGAARDAPLGARVTRRTSVLGGSP